MRFTSLILCLLIACASHAELTIFEVQRNLPLADGDKVFHDFYVDGGSEAGLKTGMILNVQRKQSMFDFYRNREVADLMVKVATVKVIQVQDGVSVVRLKDETSREDAPIADDHFIMLGDKLDVANAVVEVAPAAPTVVATPAVVIAPPAPVAAAPEPKPVAKIVVNSVDVTVDEPKATEPAPATPPAQVQ